MSANIRSLAATNFPVAPKEYDRSFIDQFINVLRLHLSNSANSINAPKVFGSYWSTLGQTNPVANAVHLMDFTNTAVAYNTSIGSPISRISVSETGIYNIQFSAQFYVTAGGGTNDLYIWLRQNGVNVPASAGKVVLSGANAEMLPAWNYVLLLKANDYVEVAWSSPDIHMALEYVAATAVIPAIPSVILTVTWVSNPPV